MRVKLLPVSSELAFNLMRGEHRGYRVVKNEIPSDAKLINVRHGWPDSVELLIQSETFEDIAEGQEIPYFMPEFESLPGLLVVGPEPPLMLCKNPEHLHDFASGDDCLK